MPVTINRWGVVLVLSLLAPLPTALGQPRLPEGVEVTRDVEYGKAGDLVLQLDLYLPKKSADRPRPVVVWIHGGGWQNGNKSSGAGRLAPLVATGDYAGVSVGYRLTDKASWPAQAHDCKAAIRWVRANAKKYNLDPERIGVWGSSAGGHLVSLLGTSADVKDLEGANGSPGVSSRVRCVVDFCGPSDFPAFAREKPGMNRSGAPVFKLLGGTVEDRADAARAASPITHVTRDDAPFLIVHGTNDQTVPLSQAQRMHDALTKAGVESTFVKIDGGAHGFGGPEVNDRVRSFLDKHLLGKDVKVSSDSIKAQPR